MEAYTSSSIPKKVTLQTLLTVPHGTRCCDKLQRVFWWSIESDWRVHTWHAFCERFLSIWQLWNIWRNWWKLAALWIMFKNSFKMSVQHYKILTRIFLLRYRAIVKTHRVCRALVTTETKVQSPTTLFSQRYEISLFTPTPYARYLFSVWGSLNLQLRRLSPVLNTYFFKKSSIKLHYIGTIIWLHDHFKIH